MIQHPKWIRRAQLIVILLCALSLKLYYSTANANQLRWILAPTTLLVEILSGQRFVFESHAGYTNGDNSFLIAPSCAGVNFLMASFLMLSLVGVWRARPGNLKWRLIPLYALIALVSTLVANTVRITTALELRGATRDILGLSPAEVHRLEGILIYFGFLLLVFLVSERMSCEAETRQRRPLDRMRRYLFPLVVYYATTLAIPLVTSVYRSKEVATDFWEHLLFVFLIPIVVLLPLAVLCLYRHTRSPVETSTDIHLSSQEGGQGAKRRAPAKDSSPLHSR